MAVCSLKDCPGACSIEVHPRTSITEEDAELLRKRSKVPRIDGVCSNHMKIFLTFYSQHQKSCYDPFMRHKKLIKSNLIVINLELSKKYPILSYGDKICVNCKVRVAKEQEEGTSASDGREKSGYGGNSSEQVGEPESQVSTGSEDLFRSGSDRSIGSNDSTFLTPPEAALQSANQGFIAFGQSPIEDRRALRSSGYLSKKAETLHAAVTSKLVKAMGVNSEGKVPIHSNQDAFFFQEMLSQLKQEFSQTKDKRRQLQILSVLPNSISVTRIMEEFGVTKYFASYAKSIVKEKGVLPVLTPKKGNKLTQDVVSKVQEFYRDSQNSRELPGRKDYVSVKVDGNRVQRQKRLVLSNLRELYTAFKQDKKYVDMKIGFTKFSELRPKECVLAGASGTHIVCVCEYHQNFKLLCEAAQIEDEIDGNVRLLTMKDFLEKVICDSPSECCYFSSCDKCPGVGVVQEMLEVHFDLYSVENVTFKQWEKTDGCKLEKRVLEGRDFIKKLVEQIPDVLKHDYLAKQQSRFFKKKKEELMEGEALVMGDFSENYTPLWQDAVQGVHWSDEQVTLHPFCIYFKKNNELQNLNYVAISDSTNHTNESVYAFQRQLVPFLKQKKDSLSKIYYFTDGAASQYKNRITLKVTI